MKRDFRKEYDTHKWLCLSCNGAWIPDARHVNRYTGQLENCKPDNLTYLEFLLGKKEQQHET